MKKIIGFLLSVYLITSGFYLFDYYINGNQLHWVYEIIILPGATIIGAFVAVIAVLLVMAIAGLIIVPFMCLATWIFED